MNSFLQKSGNTIHSGISLFGDGGRQGGQNGRGNRNGDGSGGQGGRGNTPNRQNFMFMGLATLVLLLIISYFMKSMHGTTTREISYNKFVSMIEAEELEEVSIESDRVVITPKPGVTVREDGEDYSEDTGGAFLLMNDGQITYYTGKVEDDDTITARLLEKNIRVSGSVPDSSTLVISFLLTYVLPILLMWGLLSILFRRMSRGGGPMGVGKSTAKEYVQRETGVTFADVAGEDEAKESLEEVVDFLHNPQKYVGIGAKLPKGALLVGPPGTGKTLLAKAVAGEAKVPFFSLAGSDFIELYVGVGASRVRDLFREATKNAPCIIFIDEIDAIGRSRDSRFGGGNDEREQTLNQLLSEMDGFDTSKGILVLGATNRPEILDKALLRPGRFDRRIIVDRPDLKGRIAILKVHAKDVKMDESVNLEEIALATSGAVGSDLANMINEAAINAVKHGRKLVSQADLFEAVEQVLVGKEKKDRIMSKEERRIVSYHEVGHALVAAVQKNSEPVQKITIVPRTMGALGYVMQVPEEEKYLNSKAELYDMITGLLGGRAAEELKFASVTTGASNDIQRATDIARKMVTMYGMSDRFGLMGLSTVESQYLENRQVLNCSDETAAGVDEEVRKILEGCYQEAKRILSENLDIMDQIAEVLIEQETITGKEFMRIYRKAKGLPETDDRTADEKELDRLHEEQEAAKAGQDPAKIVREIAETSREATETSQESAGTVPETAGTAEASQETGTAEPAAEQEQQEAGHQDAPQTSTGFILVNPEAEEPKKPEETAGMDEPEGTEKSENPEESEGQKKSAEPEKPAEREEQAQSEPSVQETGESHIGRYSGTNIDEI